MNKAILLIIAVLSFSSCKHTTEIAEKDETPKVQVKVTTVSEGYIPDYLSLTGKTIYYNKNTIVSPINGYVTKVNVQQGDRVSKNTVLFEIQTKETFAIKKTDSLANQYGQIKVTAPANGIITALSVVQQGVYIDQGSAMCVVVGSNNLKVIVSVPFEFGRYAKIGNPCKIILPDSTQVSAVFSKVLPQMNEQTQTMKVQANLYADEFIPEDMLVTVLVEKEKSCVRQILPKSCVMTDALMTKYWVMQLINDTTAVQIPVTAGIESHNKVEILAPVFTDTDRFISEGAYGLSDTVLVTIK